VKQIKKFTIEGLFGSKNIGLDIEGDCLILVGPNGIGKSTVINIFYFFVSRQWSRLLDYKFDSITIEFKTSTITAYRSDITGLYDIERISRDSSPGSLTRVMFNKLAEADLLDEFVSSPRMSAGQRGKFAQALNVSSADVSMFQRVLSRKMTADENDLFRMPRLTLEKTIGKAFPSRTLYLPTYRRIEKELNEVFPEINQRFRQFTGREMEIETKRSSDHYVDLVNFGMEDVKSNLDKSGRELRDYSLEKYNNLSALYLRDVIQEKANEYVVSELNSLDEEDIIEILSRVSETALPKEDKGLLLSKIRKIQGQSPDKISQNEKYLAHYFSRLVDVTDEIRQKEKGITSFVNVCNTYLNPQKYMIYDEFDYKVFVYDSNRAPIDLSLLSSGEKQIVSVFSHLFLDDSTEQIVVIDEPELSLSVPWQKMLLQDILDSERCSFVLAVTHSPFIYDNNLRNSARDLRQFFLK